MIAYKNNKTNYILTCTMMTHGKCTHSKSQKEKNIRKFMTTTRPKLSLITDTWNMCWAVNMKRQPYPHGLAIFRPHGPSLCSTYCLWLFVQLKFHPLTIFLCLVCFTHHPLRCCQVRTLTLSTYALKSQWKFN